MSIKGIFTILAGSALILSGCNSGTGPGMTPVTASQMHGTWNFTTGTVFGITMISCVGEPDSTETDSRSYNFTDTTDRISFDTTGMTYSLILPWEFGAGMETGTWSVSGNTLTLVEIVPEPDTTLVTISISGTTLSFSFPETEFDTESNCTFSTNRTISGTLTKR